MPARTSRYRVLARPDFDVDHGLADHRAAAHAAEEARRRVRNALAPRFPGLVGATVGDLVDELAVISVSMRPTSASPARTGR